MSEVAMKKSAATESDERYGEIFDLITHAAQSGMPLIENYYPAMHKARAEAPVQKGTLAEILKVQTRGGGFTTERQHYTTLSFPTVDKVLSNNTLYSSIAYLEFLPTISFGKSILSLTGTEHRQYRGTVQSLFTKLRAQDWWANMWIKPLIGELIETFEQRGFADLNQELCARLPMHTVTRAFGLDPADAMEFRFNLMQTLNYRLPAEKRQRAEDVCAELLMNTITLRRAAGADDVITMLVQSQFVDDDGTTRTLSDEEIVNFCKLILAAGGGTTWRQLGITLYALLTNPEQFEAVKADRKLIDNAIQESLRWHNTSPLFFRLATEDSELGGVDIPEGSIVEFSLAAANRDPQRWENPDKYDIFRPAQRHLAFGGGPHTCLGMFVAMSEMRLAIDALIDRLPNLRFDPAHEAPRITGTLEMRGVSHLRVVFDPAG